MARGHMSLTRRSVIKVAGVAGSLLLAGGILVWAETARRRVPSTPRDYLRLSSALPGGRGCRVGAGAAGWHSVGALVRLTMLMWLHGVGYDGTVAGSAFQIAQLGVAWAFRTEPARGDVRRRMVEW